MTLIEAIHLSPRIFNIKGWVKQTDAQKLKATFDSILDQSNFKVLNYTDHQFPLNGFTAFWLLAESHLAIHTFNDSGWSYLELSSCNKEKAMNFLTLTEQLNTEFRWENDIEELSCEDLINTHSNATGI